jgi:hypothetical protein
MRPARGAYDAQRAGSRLLWKVTGTSPWSQLHSTFPNPLKASKIESHPNSIFLLLNN